MGADTKSALTASHALELLHAQRDRYFWVADSATAVNSGPLALWKFCEVIFLARTAVFQWLHKGRKSQGARASRADDPVAEEPAVSDA